MSREKLVFLFKGSGFFLFLLFLAVEPCAQPETRGRARDFGIEIGIIPQGKWNAITDVAGVKVGHLTLIEGDSIRTGVTAVIPHGGNLFREKVPGAVYVGNGFGKLVGSTQVEELGEIETPIVLTNTLSVSTAMRAVVEYMLRLPGNEGVQSVNAVVGETNDGWLNDIRGLHVDRTHVWETIRNANDGPVEEGSVGAGTGTTCFGFKGGIGTASRILPGNLGGWTVGVLVQTNFGGVLCINGAPVGRELNQFSYRRQLSKMESGSCMIIVATDAPLMHRNLKRLASRAILGLARCGGFCSNGSGDYVVAFSAHPECRSRHGAPRTTKTSIDVQNGRMSPLFLAAVEATEEAVLNSMFAAEAMDGRAGHRADALPIGRVLDICKKYKVLNLLETLPPGK